MAVPRTHRQKEIRRHLWIYGVGGIIVPFIGIKAIDMLLVALRLV